jgi:hypothetical protein
VTYIRKVLTTPEAVSAENVASELNLVFSSPDDGVPRGIEFWCYLHHPGKLWPTFSMLVVEEMDCMLFNDPISNESVSLTFNYFTGRKLSIIFKIYRRIWPILRYYPSILVEELRKRVQTSGRRFGVETGDLQTQFRTFNA